MLQMLKDTNASLTSKVMSAHAQRVTMERRMSELQDLVRVNDEVESEESHKVRALEDTIAELKAEAQKVQRVHESQLWEEQQAAEARLKAREQEMEAEKAAAVHEAEARAAEAVQRQLVKDKDDAAELRKQVESLKAEHRVYQAKVAADVRKLEEQARKDEAARQQATVDAVQAQLEAVRQDMTAQAEAFAEERASHRELVDSVREEQRAAERETAEWRQRFEEAERTHAKERASEAAAWQKARQALSEGISGEIDERRKAEMATNEAKREVASLRAEVAGLNRIIEQMRRSSEELQRKAEAVVSSASAESITAAQEASKLKALVEMHAEAADALPKLKTQLDAQNQLTVRLEETNSVLADQNNQLREVAETLQQQQSKLLEKLKQYEGEEQAYRDTIEGLRDDVQARDAEIRKYRLLVPKHLQVDEADAATIAETLASAPKGMSASNPEVVKAMASPALAAVLARVDGSISAIQAEQGGKSGAPPRAGAPKHGQGDASGAGAGAGAGAGSVGGSTRLAPLVRCLLAAVMRACDTARRRAAFRTWRGAVAILSSRAEVHKAKSQAAEQAEEMQDLLAQAQAQVLAVQQAGSEEEQGRRARFEAAIASVRNVEQWRTKSTVAKLQQQLEVLLNNNRQKEDVRG